MSYTSAQSGDNYRNWWPHPVMTAFTNDSLDELDRLAVDTGNIFNMKQGGYLLATRRTDISELLDALQDGIDVDVLSGREVAGRFPHFSPDIRHVLHVRRAGSIDGHQLGTWMLEQVRASGGRRFQAEVTAIESDGNFLVHIAGARTIRADHRSRRKEALLDRGRPNTARRRPGYAMVDEDHAGRHALQA